MPRPRTLAWVQGNSNGAGLNTETEVVRTANVRGREPAATSGVLRFYRAEKVQVCVQLDPGTLHCGAVADSLAEPFALAPDAKTIVGIAVHPQLGAVDRFCYPVITEYGTRVTKIGGAGGRIGTCARCRRDSSARCPRAADRETRRECPRDRQVRRPRAGRVCARYNGRRGRTDWAQQY